MLGSITPLGERGRRSRWGLTVAAFVLASSVAAAGLGAILGTIGSAIGVRGSLTSILVLAGLLAVALALDARLGGLHLPTVNRQVDEQWLPRYRGWVTGVGFGFQLGLGVVTIVTTAFTYVTFAAAALSGSAAGGALIGAAFGLLRGGTILVGAGVDSPERLVQLDTRLRRWERPTQRALVAAQVVLLALTVNVAATAL